MAVHFAEGDHHYSAYSLTGYGLNDAFDKSLLAMARWKGQEFCEKPWKVAKSSRDCRLKIV
ncbi:hypothetical protein ACJX0J_029440, partial [Zea mays]